MTLWHLLRHPSAKPPVQTELDRRQDEVERRLEKILTPEAANRAQRIIRASGHRG